MRLSLFVKNRINLLKKRKFRDDYGEYVVEGFKFVEEAIGSNQDILCILINDSIASNPRIKDIKDEANKKSIKIFAANDKDLKYVSSLETPPGILAVIKKKNTQPFSKKITNRENGEPYLILDEIRDPGNLGTIIRSADWFGFNNLILSKGCVDAYNSKVLQSTMGSIFNVNLIENQNLTDVLKVFKNDGYKIIAAVLEGDKKLPEIKNKKFAVIIGNESRGLNKEIFKFIDFKYEIAGKGKAESLNVAVATGIILFELSLLPLD